VDDDGGPDLMRPTQTALTDQQIEQKLKEKVASLTHLSSDQREEVLELLLDPLLRPLFNEEIVGIDPEFYTAECSLRDDVEVDWPTRTYSMNASELEALDELLDRLMACGAIRRATAAERTLSSPSFFVAKPGGKLRFVIDYRRVNAMMKKDCYPLPRTREFLENVSRTAGFVSVVDLQSGF